MIDECDFLSESFQVNRYRGTFHGALWIFNGYVRDLNAMFILMAWNNRRAKMFLLVECLQGGNMS